MNSKQNGTYLRRNRSDGRLKTYKSSDDCRVWNPNKRERQNYISDYIQSSYERFQGDTSKKGKYVPVPVLEDVVIQIYKDEAQELRAKLQKVQQELTDCEKGKNVYSGEGYNEYIDTDIQDEEAYEIQQDGDAEEKETEIERYEAENVNNSAIQDIFTSKTDSDSQAESFTDALGGNVTETSVHFKEKVLQIVPNEQWEMQVKYDSSGFHENLKSYENEIEKKEGEVKDLLQKIDSLVEQEGKRINTMLRGEQMRTNMFTGSVIDARKNALNKGLENLKKDIEKLSVVILALDSSTNKSCGQNEEKYLNKMENFEDCFTMCRKVLKDDCLLNEEAVNQLPLCMHKFPENNAIECQLLSYEQKLSELEMKYQSLMKNLHACKSFQRGQIKEKPGMNKSKQLLNRIIDKLRQSMDKKMILRKRLENKETSHSKDNTYEMFPTPESNAEMKHKASIAAIEESKNPMIKSKKVKAMPIEGEPIKLQSSFINDIPAKESEQEMGKGLKFDRMQDIENIPTDLKGCKCNKWESTQDINMIRQECKELYWREGCCSENGPKQKSKPQAALLRCSRIALMRNGQPQSFQRQLKVFEMMDELNGAVSGRSSSSEISKNKIYITRENNMSKTCLTNKQCKSKTDDGKGPKSTKPCNTSLIHLRERPPEFERNIMKYKEEIPNFIKRPSNVNDTPAYQEQSKIYQTEVLLALEDIETLYPHKKCTVCTEKLKHAFDVIKYNSLGTEKIKSLKEEAKLYLRHKNCSFCKKEADRILNLLGEKVE